MDGGDDVTAPRRRNGTIARPKAKTTRPRAQTVPRPAERGRVRPVRAGASPRPVRLAAIDIGTNTLRSMIVEAETGEGYRILDTEKIPNRLGEGLGGQGSLGAEAWQRTLSGLGRLREIARGHGCREIAVVATSALREATNGRAFVAEVRRRLGLRVRIIDGDEEARLAFQSAWHSFPLKGERIALLDVGGGSAEVVLAMGPLIEEIASLPLGAVRLTERFVHHDPPLRSEVKEMRRHVRAVLTEHLPRAIPGVHMIASGGSANAVARILVSRQGEKSVRAHGADISRAEVEHLYELVRAMDGGARRQLRGLSPDRIDIILAGVLVLREAMRSLGARRMLVNEGGIREGLILRMLERRFPAEQTGGRHATRDPFQSARRFAAICRYEAKHAETVRGFAVALFRALHRLHGLGEAEREVLELAAILHDIGYFIAYPGHHRHSYHLIANARLEGLDRRQQELTAVVARYHRRSLPRESHPEFARLSPADRHAVLWLAGILRLADGLDRGHAGRVRGVRVRILAETVRIGLTSTEPVDLEIWGGERKRDLLQKVLRRDVVLARAFVRAATGP